MTHLSEALFSQIVDQGLAEFPNECCGVIAAEDGVPVRVFPMTNADASTVTYRLDGKEQLRVFNEMDERGWELWAIYHSHTHSEAYPSETDIRRAHYPDGNATYPDVRYILVSLEDRANPVLRSFTFVDGQVSEEELVLA